MIRILSVLLLASMAVNATAQTTAPAAAKAAQPATGAIEIADNAPERYTVVKGDTLWDISGRFLKKPWLWPQVWQMNREQIRDPHWIYPGQVVVLDRSGAQPRLYIDGAGAGANGSTSGMQRLSPQIYSTQLDNPVASVPMEAIQSFLVEPLVVEAQDLNSSPTVVAIEEGRVLAGVGDKIFAKNLQGKESLWQIYRPAAPIKDPVTNALLGYEAVAVGSAQLISSGETDGKREKAAELRIVSGKHEVNAGDRLRPAGKPVMLNLAPHAPAQNLVGRVVSIFGGVGNTGRYGVVLLNVGKQQGVEPGHVFALYRNRGTVTYRGDGKPEQYDLPEDRYGLAFVFSSFTGLSYALVLDANAPVSAADVVRAP